MISYGPFWDTLEKKKISTYALRETQRISPHTLTRMRQNRYLSLRTIDDLCRDPGLPHPGYRGIQERGVTGIGDGGPLCTSRSIVYVWRIPAVYKAGDSTRQSSFARTKRKLSL